MLVTLDPPEARMAFRESVSSTRRKLEYAGEPATARNSILGRRRVWGKECPVVELCLGVV